MHLQKLDRIISAEGELQPVVAKARDLRTLAGLVDGFLSADLAREARVANYRDSELVLIAANSSAAAKLKLLAPALVRFLTGERWQVKLVSVRVQPSRSQAAPARQKTVHLSTHALNSLRALHASLTPSPAREALAKLLRRYGALDASSRTAPEQKTAAKPPPQQKARP